MVRFQTAINAQVEGYDDDDAGGGGVQSGDESYGDGADLIFVIFLHTDFLAQVFLHIDLEKNGIN